MRYVFFVILLSAALTAICAGGDGKTTRELLSRIDREPFHAELLCEEIVKTGDGALPSLEEARQSENLAKKQAALRCIVSIKWKIPVRCFYATGMSLEETIHFSDTQIKDAMRLKIGELEKEGKIKELAEIASTGDAVTAISSLEAIERLDKSREAAETFLRSVQPSDWFYAGVLFAHKPDEVLPAVTATLNSHQENRKLAAISCLIVGSSPKTFDKLISSLKHKSSLVRLRSAQALGIMGDGRALESLADALRKDKDPTVRAEAAWAMGLLENREKAGETLVKALKDDKRQVKTRVIESLAVAGTQSALDALSAFAKDSGEDSLARNRAIRAIGQIGKEGALEKLKPLFAEEDDAYSTVPAVIGSLGPVAIPFIRETIEKADNSDFKTYTKCQLALGTMGADAVPLLLDFLGSEKNVTRLAGRTLLRRLTGEDFEYDREAWEKHLRENPLK